MAKKKNYYLWKKDRQYWTIRGTGRITCIAFRRKRLISYLASVYGDLDNFHEHLNCFVNNKYKTFEEFLDSPFESYYPHCIAPDEELMIVTSYKKIVPIKSILKEVEEEIIKNHASKSIPKKENKLPNPEFRVDSVPYTGIKYRQKCWRKIHGERQRFEDYEYFKNGYVNVETDEEDITYHIKEKTNPAREWHGGGKSLYTSKSWKRDKKCKHQWMKHLDKRKSYGLAPDITLEEEMLLAMEYDE